MLEKSFHFRDAEVSSKSSNLLVEQVNWSQSRHAAEILTNLYEQPELGFAVAKSLTTALQAEPNTQLFLAYDDKPAGTMVTFETGGKLSAMLLVDSDGEPRVSSYSRSRDKGVESSRLRSLAR